VKPVQRRNLGGRRLEASERVVLVPQGSEGEDTQELTAWTLNLSHGGLRVVVEDPIVVGAEYLVSVGEAEARRARVVWLRQESDGQIAGMKFSDSLGEDRGSSLPQEPASD
jgi:hypothetical protein